ncbi:hypothetical protein DDZ13_12550 [Coraliomargarita sinensis]|uniref:Uncharacterized protein n=1 Tax=Coraliomargarita sinensis TaxID=2174842 RepID=A0A317ZDS3_9BACT|nr:hypothetical protein [Coraliomargarita sinensis]PXA03250.1 hypothetical protein DDZ13_12550 [Coraliomargarita sinensis]
MDWQIKTLSRKSTLSGESFEPGDRAVSLVYVDDEAGDLGRADIHEKELSELQAPGQVLGRWSWVMKDPEEGATSTSDTVASAEDFFFSLFENEAGDERERSDALKHLLALMLERKRILRAIGPRQTSGTQTYLHVKTKQELKVPITEISRDLMFKIEDTLGDIIL